MGKCLDCSRKSWKASIRALPLTGAVYLCIDARFGSWHEAVIQSLAANQLKWASEQVSSSWWAVCLLSSPSTKDLSPWSFVQGRDGWPCSDTSVLDLVCRIRRVWKQKQQTCYVCQGAISWWHGVWFCSSWQQSPQGVASRYFSVVQFGQQLSGSLTFNIFTFPAPE